MQVLRNLWMLSSVGLQIFSILGYLTGPTWPAAVAIYDWQDLMMNRVESAATLRAREEFSHGPLDVDWEGRHTHVYSHTLARYPRLRWKLEYI